MPTPPPDFLPKPVKGSREASPHRLQVWSRCRMEFYHRYLRPFPATPKGEGWEPLSTSAPLLIGGLYHTAREAYFLSGFRDGEDTGAYSIDAAIAALEADAKERHAEAHPETMADAAEKAAVLIRRYHDWHGPGGHAPLWPSLKTVADGAGQPLIEREFRLDLTADEGPTGWFLVCKPDRIVSDGGYLNVEECKTADTSRASGVIRSAPMDGQFTAENFVLHTLYPEAHIHGVRLEVAIKNPGQKREGSPFLADVTTRTPVDLEVFRLNTLKTLREIDAHVGELLRLCQQGVDEPQAALLVFNRDGPHNGSCYTFGKCPYWELCSMPGYESEKHGAFRPRRES